MEVKTLGVKEIENGGKVMYSALASGNGCAGYEHGNDRDSGNVGFE